RRGDLLLERGELLGVEPALAGERADVTRALGLPGRDRRRVRVRLALELGELGRTAVEALREEGERGAGVTRAGDERPVLLRGEAEAVDRGEGVLERVRAQDDRERVGAALLVQRAEALRQAGLGGVQRDACDAQLSGDGRALAGHGVGARA